MPEPVARRRFRIREIRTADDPAFVAAHAMLRREFHRAEMLPVADWRNALRERAGNLWTDVAWHLLVAEQDGDVMAAASGSYLGNLNTAIIGYIAVVPEARSYGVGPRMRDALRRRFERDARRVRRAPLEAIVGEVREDNPWLRHLVRRGGVLALDFPYYQPSLRASGKPVQLVMYYQPLTRRRRSLSAAALRRLLYSMWRRAYRISRPLDHPEFRRMLRSLNDRRMVGQRPLPATRR
ncbi:MAG: GNAT family N-acetyltransferase [Gemmatimonadaceae bacterium]